MSAVSTTFLLMLAVFVLFYQTIFGLVSCSCFCMVCFSYKRAMLFHGFPHQIFGFAVLREPSMDWNALPWVSSSDFLLLSCIFCFSIGLQTSWWTSNMFKTPSGCKIFKSTWLKWWAMVQDYSFWNAMSCKVSFETHFLCSLVLKSVNLKEIRVVVNCDKVASAGVVHQIQCYILPW